MIGLEYIRKLYSDTVDTLAEKLGVTKGVISQWENSKSAIPVKRIAQLCTIYPIPEKYFTKELSVLEQLEIQHIKISADFDASFHEYEAPIKFDSDGKPIEYATFTGYDNGLNELLRDIETDINIEKIVEQLRYTIKDTKQNFNDEYSFMDYVDDKETNVNLIRKFISLMKENDAMFLAYILRAVELSNDDSWGENPKLDRNGLTGRVLNAINEWKAEEKKRQEAEYQEYKELFGLDDESEE